MIHYEKNAWLRMLCSRSDMTACHVRGLRPNVTDLRCTDCRAHSDRGGKVFGWRAFNVSRQRALNAMKRSGKFAGKT